jgi:hypothetical protein
VLPVVSKMFEKLVFSQIYGYFMKENMFSDHQSDFRPNHSTEIALHKSLMYWYKHKDKGDIGIAVIIDLKKAFDTVDHNILLNKLMRYGIKDNELKMVPVISVEQYSMLLCQWSSFKQPNNITRSTAGLYPWTAVIFYIHH